MGLGDKAEGENKMPYILVNYDGNIVAVHEKRNAKYKRDAEGFDYIKVNEKVAEKFREKLESRGKDLSLQGRVVRITLTPDIKTIEFRVR